MRHAPCGYVPYGGVRSMIVGHDHWACRPRKRQTVVPARDCHGRKRPRNDMEGEFVHSG